MTGINPVMSTITLNGNGLWTPKRQKLSVGIKKRERDSSIGVYKKPILHLKTHID